MSFKASFHLIPKDLIEEVKSKTSYRELYPIVESLTIIASDFCTDAIIDIYPEIEKRTEFKLTEEDAYLGILDKETFCKFIQAIHKRTTRFIMSFRHIDDELFNYYISQFQEWDKLDSNQFALTKGPDWINAYFTAIYWLKTIDWNKYSIYFEIG